MHRLGIIVTRIAVLIALVMLVNAYFRYYPRFRQTEQVRYRVTVQIGTPNGVKTGSGVWGLSWAPTFGIPLYHFQWWYNERIEGEAIPILLDDHKRAFLLLGGRTVAGPPNSGRRAGAFGVGFMNGFPLQLLWDGASFAPKDAPSGSRAAAMNKLAWAKAQRGREVRLDCALVRGGDFFGTCPAIAVVRDEAGAHIQLLDPADLSDTLGRGYRLQGVTLQVTNDPITHGIEKLLPWVRPATWQDLAYASEDETMRRQGFSRKDPAHSRD